MQPTESASNNGRSVWVIIVRSASSRSSERQCFGRTRANAMHFGITSPKLVSPRVVDETRLLQDPPAAVRAGPEGGSAGLYRANGSLRDLGLERSHSASGQLRTFGTPARR